MRAELRHRYAKDATLYGWRLVVEPGRVYLAQRATCDVALVVNLATCAAQVADGPVQVPLTWEVEGTRYALDANVRVREVADVEENGYV